jgi:hypothetical protein
VDHDEGKGASAKAKRTRTKRKKTAGDSDPELANMLQRHLICGDEHVSTRKSAQIAAKQNADDEEAFHNLANTARANGMGLLSFVSASRSQTQTVGT